MRTIRLALIALLTACSASAAWAQYGLYGSPDLLRLPQQDTAAADAAPINYPSTATPAAPSAASVYGYPAQPAYRYGAQPQPPAMASYPQYQAAYPQYQATYAPYPTTAQYQASTQYYYPAPASRPPVRTAAVEPVPANQPAPVAPGPAAAPVPAQTPATPYVGPAPQGPGVMNQMLNEQNAGCCAGGGVYRGAVNQFDQGASAACAGSNLCGAGYFCPWYASVSALSLGRSDSRRLWTSYEDGNLPNQIMNSQFPMDWKWGGEVRLGHRFCWDCVPCAIEGTFWTTQNFTGSQTATVAGGAVSTTMDVDYITFHNSETGADEQAANWFFGSQSQTIARRDEFYNFELNLIREQLAWACDSPWDIGWSCGVRYFRFQEDLRYSALRANYAATDPVGTALFDDTATNNLIGFQFGFNAAYNVCNGFRLFVTPQVGIYDNIMESVFQAQLADGTKAVSQYYGPYNPDPRGTKNGISFLTQIDVGAEWQITRNWSARAGYRVVAVTGMALADDQYPQYMTDIPEMQRVQTSGSLVLHGAFFGLTYCF
jgi:hypothetical protein